MLVDGETSALYNQRNLADKLTVERQYTNVADDCEQARNDGIQYFLTIIRMRPREAPYKAGPERCVNESLKSSDPGLEHRVNEGL